MVFEDDQGDNPNGAINAVNKLMQVSKVPVMIGPHYSVTQMATQKTYCNGKVVSVTGGTSVAITHSGCNYGALRDHARNGHGPDGGHA